MVLFRKAFIIYKSNLMRKKQKEMSVDMKCAMVILNYRDSERAKKLAEKCSEYETVEKIVIVDNDSQDGSYDFLQKIANNKIEVLKAEKNGGFSAGNNVGAKYVFKKYNPEYIFFANTDTSFPEENIISCMEVLQQNQDLGLVSTRMLGPDGKEQNSTYEAQTYKTYIKSMFWINRKKNYNRFSKGRTFTDKVERVDIVRGSFMFFRMKALKEADFFDEHTFLYCEETIISERLKRVGYKVGLLTDLFYIHDHWETNSNPSATATKRLYESKYYVAVHYWGIGKIKQLFFRLCIGYSIGEAWVVEKLKGLKKGGSR